MFLKRGEKNGNKIKMANTCKWKESAVGLGKFF
jgi:hypothetical protein